MLLIEQQKPFCSKSTKQLVSAMKIAQEQLQRNTSEVRAVKSEQIVKEEQVKEDSKRGTKSVSQCRLRPRMMSKASGKEYSKANC